MVTILDYSANFDIPSIRAIWFLEKFGCILSLEQILILL